MKEYITRKPINISNRSSFDSLSNSNLTIYDGLRELIDNAIDAGSNDEIQEIEIQLETELTKKSKRSTLDIKTISVINKNPKKYFTGKSIEALTKLRESNIISRKKSDIGKYNVGFKSAIAKICKGVKDENGNPAYFNETFEVTSGNSYFTFELNGVSNYMLKTVDISENPSQHTVVKLTLLNDNIRAMNPKKFIDNLKHELGEFYCEFLKKNLKITLSTIESGEEKKSIDVESIDNLYLKHPEPHNVKPFKAKIDFQDSKINITAVSLYNKKHIKEYSNWPYEEKYAAPIQNDYPLTISRNGRIIQLGVDNQEWMKENIFTKGQGNAYTSSFRYRLDYCDPILDKDFGLSENKNRFNDSNPALIDAILNAKNEKGETLEAWKANAEYVYKEKLIKENDKRSYEQKEKDLKYANKDINSEIIIMELGNNESIKYNDEENTIEVPRKVLEHQNTEKISEIIQYIELLNDHRTEIYENFQHKMQNSAELRFLNLALKELANKAIGAMQVILSDKLM